MTINKNKTMLAGILIVLFFVGSCSIDKKTPTGMTGENFDSADTTLSIIPNLISVRVGEESSFLVERKIDGKFASYLGNTAVSIYGGENFIAKISYIEDESQWVAEGIACGEFGFTAVDEFGFEARAKVVVDTTIGFVMPHWLSSISANVPFVLGNDDGETATITFTAEYTDGQGSQTITPSGAQSTDATIATASGNVITFGNVYGVAILTFYYEEAGIEKSETVAAMRLEPDEPFVMPHWLSSISANVPFVLGNDDGETATITFTAEYTDGQGSQTITPSGAQSTDATIATASGNVITFGNVYGVAILTFYYEEAGIEKSETVAAMRLEPDEPNPDQIPVEFIVPLDSSNLWLSLNENHKYLDFGQCTDDSLVENGRFSFSAQYTGWTVTVSVEAKYGSYTQVDPMENFVMVREDGGGQHFVADPDSSSPVILDPGPSVNQRWLEIYCGRFVWSGMSFRLTVWHQYWAIREGILSSDWPPSQTDTNSIHFSAADDGHRGKIRFYLIPPSF